MTICVVTIILNFSIAQDRYICCFVQCFQDPQALTGEMLLSLQILHMHLATPSRFVQTIPFGHCTSGQTAPEENEIEDRENEKQKRNTCYSHRQAVAFAGCLLSLKLRLVTDGVSWCWINGPQQHAEEQKLLSAEPRDNISPAKLSFFLRETVADHRIIYSKLTFRRTQNFRARLGCS